jgi:hypothetical protein
MNPWKWRLRAQICAGALVALLAGTFLPVGSAHATTKPVIPVELFGAHYHSISSSQPSFRVGAIRLWDSGVNWARLNPAPGVFEWDALDRAVDNARNAGALEVQYVFGVTPQWAAASPAMSGLYGPGTSSPPARMAYFTDFARAMAERYRGRITSYEIWNEGSLKIFFGGTAKQLADLTIQGSRAIKSVDPGAKVLSASSTYGVFTRRPKFWKEYALRLKNARWPIDAVTIHPYSKTPDYLAKRASMITGARAYYRKYGFKGPIWDTEVNYGDRRNVGTGWLQVSYGGEVAAGMVARTYIDAMRLGVPRVFWYGWDYHLFGIDMVDASSGAMTEAGVAFNTLQDWMVGKRWYGCTTTGHLRSCRLRGPGAARTTIVYATSKTRSYTIPTGVSGLQNLSGQVLGVVPGQKIRVNANPILIQGA